METGRCLWMVTNQNIFGFRVENLELLGKNNNDARERDSEPIILPHLPFDFRFKLPKPNLHPFLFDSNIFFAGGSPDFSPDASPHYSTTMYQLSSDSDAIAEVEAAGTIPVAPTLMYQCNVANIQGDVYLLVHDSLTQESKLGFWVLRSGSSPNKQWHPLPPPPTLRYYLTNDKPPYVYHHWWSSSIWNDKLFLNASFDSEEIKSLDNTFIYYVYHPEKDDDPWQRRELNSSGLGHALCHPNIAAVPSLGKVANCDVTLTWMPGDWDPTYTSDVKIYALLVDKHDNVLRQECLPHEAMAIPFSFNSNSINVNFVDLGEGKVCVLIGGIEARRGCYPNPILCVLVLKLGLVQEEQEEGQRFLSVDQVLVNRVYDMAPYIVYNSLEAPQSSFLSSFKHYPYSQGSNSPKKEPKLASGTSPTNPRAILELPLFKEAAKLASGTNPSQPRTILKQE
ncbi:hypothetical protein PIB30_027654 [Stylosanthes scabra]|uniref:Uncharacterized protein n=1 Tax=Stylosanthes scabra TaxID=79078 RepID=A0ABU6RBH3_9FABA|nr:hypothetical protein [Stylosanthes scabra]